MRRGKDLVFLGLYLVIVLSLTGLNSLPGGEGLGGEDGLQVLRPNDSSKQYKTGREGSST